MSLPAREELSTAINASLEQMLQTFVFVSVIVIVPAAAGSVGKDGVCRMLEEGSARADDDIMMGDAVCGLSMSNHDLETVPPPPADVMEYKTKLYYLSHAYKIHFVQLSIFHLPAVKLLQAFVHYANTGKETLSAKKY